SGDWISCGSSPNMAATLRSCSAFCAWSHSSEPTSGTSTELSESCDERARTPIRLAPSRLLRAGSVPPSSIDELPASTKSAPALIELPPSFFWDGSAKRGSSWGKVSETAVLLSDIEDVSERREDEAPRSRYFEIDSPGRMIGSYPAGGPYCSRSGRDSA